MAELMTPKARNWYGIMYGLAILLTVLYFLLGGK